jgi:hypothetical protein
VASLNITNSRNRTLLNVTPNAFPATRYAARRDFGDDSVVEYIQVSLCLRLCLHHPIDMLTFVPRTPRQSPRATAPQPCSFA